MQIHECNHHMCQQLFLRMEPKESGTERGQRKKKAPNDLYHIVQWRVGTLIFGKLTTLVAAKLVLLKTSFSEENAASLL